ncbi:hypothetical protein SAY87_023968 [Trapa incisa]|uniref:Protein RER1 n=2 Tax=Trapa TaxID=22665 RepID=A0AAN7KKS1_TRANT|nr:hypothetical protein SAY86_014640 [Trapa natans]KAK4776007.1 hypothetical protein SAY87_023968 [Trapa incisa]
METARVTVASSEGISSASTSSTLARWTFIVSQRYRHVLDKSVPYVLYRWIAFMGLSAVYFLRVYLIQGFYIVTYALGIYMLNLLIGFLSPQVDPEMQDLLDGPTLPTRRSDEFRPFVRRIPEFKFWISSMYAFLISFTVTFFPIFDVPVFWPILLFYWMVLFTATMRRQITMMIKYKYLPFTSGKRTYGKRSSPTETANLAKD